MSVSAGLPIDPYTGKLLSTEGVEVLTNKGNPIYISTERCPVETMYLPNGYYIKTKEGAKVRRGAAGKVYALGVQTKTDKYYTTSSTATYNFDAPTVKPNFTNLKVYTSDYYLPSRAHSYTYNVNNNYLYEDDTPLVTTKNSSLVKISDIIIGYTQSSQPVYAVTMEDGKFVGSGNLNIPLLGCAKNTDNTYEFVRQKISGKEIIFDNLGTQMLITPIN